MKLGFFIPIVGPAISSAAGLSAFCRGLEDLGYDTLWVGDRLVTPVDVDSTYLTRGPQMGRYLDPVLLWTVAATATSRMRLNSSTLSTFYYEPPHLARLLTTLDVLSDGRLGVGVGLGWMKQEYDIARNADWHRRGKMLDDMLDTRTATGEAILPPADGTAGPVPARIVMMTDGKRTVGRTEQDAAQQAADVKVPVSMIAFGTDHGSITYQGSQIPVPLDTQSMQQIAAISGGDYHTASTAAELQSVYAQLSEQIGYETTQQDVSRPWLIAGTLLAILGAATAVSARIP